ncbi:carboxypeptidase N subunit 2-like [Cyprinodon tularosa]|uniref:carboxypeptidase N subunit 2-like n=1 Tax=Cyprinodon tularosa TaxID=77115 RepID=UPI0018E26B93|nr:carboxypeptidase N subunit 2-like [Cyprinodon tularosa]
MDRQLGQTLLLLLLLCRSGDSDWQSVCPYKCQCFTSLQVLCADERMSSFPRVISRQVREVVIMTSSLAYLFPTSLTESPQLTKLVFLNNALRSIHSDTFEHLTELRELELSGNPPLDHLYLGTFSKQENLTKLLLNYNSLKTVLPGMFDSLKQLEVLQMKGNLLSGLPPLLFQNLGSLHFLDLSQNRLQNLTEGTFSGLAGLKILRLNNNLISNLTWETLRSVPQLTELHLEWNRISHLDDNVFSAMTNLSVLNLRGNLLNSFSDAAFGSELTNLRELNLKGNRLTELSSLSHLSSLTDLMLSANRLSSLKENSFRNLTALETLDLSDNQLASLPEGIFNALWSISVINLHNNHLEKVDAKLIEDQIMIERLYLSDNRLETLPPGLLDNSFLQLTVRLHGNPWRCDCQLRYLYDWLLTNSSDREILDRLSCQSPGFLRGRTVGSVGRDQLVCHPAGNQAPDLNSCWLQEANDTMIIRCRVEKCSAAMVRLQLEEESGEIREHIFNNTMEKSQCSNETLNARRID